MTKPKLPTILIENLAHDFGQEARHSFEKRLSELCSSEKLRIEKHNEPEIRALEIRREALVKRRDEFEEISRCNPPDARASSRAQRWFDGMTVLIFAVTSYFFVHLALDPFGFGWKTWLFSLGVALLGVVSTDIALEKLGSQTVIKAVCIVAWLAGLGSFLVMAILRGEIVSLYLQNALASTGGGAAFQGSIDTAADFYGPAAVKLRWIFALLTVAIELTAGILLHEARRRTLLSSDEGGRARKELERITTQMADLEERRVTLINEPGLMEAVIRRDFPLHADRGFMNGKKANGLARLSAACIFLGLIAQGCTPAISSNPAATLPFVLVGLDQTASVANTGYDDESDYAKNVKALQPLIAQLPPGARLKVVSISDQSFSKPHVLFSTKLPENTGDLKFFNRVEAEKKRAAAEVRALSDSLRLRFQKTDVFGFLLYASAVLKEVPYRRKVLVIFSDMRDSRAVDLESPRQLRVAEALQSTNQQKLIADLTGVEVFVYGVHAQGKDAVYWDSLKAFWTAYFKESGADLRTFSMTRSVERLWRDQGREGEQ